jgi:magnesium transporter
MDEQSRARLQTLLAFPPGTVGSVMQLNTVAVRGDVCIATVTRYLRRLGAIPSHTNRLMVVDRDNHYRGSVRLGDLFLHDPGTRVCDILESGVLTLSPDADLKEVARLFEQRDYISLPVVDAEGVLLGRITVDDIVPVIRRDVEHQVMSRAGLSEEDDMLAPGWPTARRRMVWLGINLLTALLAAWVIGLFEATIEQVVALAVLMPLVASMGGIAGTQTLTVVVRSMALGRLDRARLPWMLRRELFSALVNGLVWSASVGLLALLWFGKPVLSLVVGVALLVNQFAAALAGALIPLILERMKIDPALAGGVILTTVTDVVGFFTLLGLGSAVLIS